MQAKCIAYREDGMICGQVATILDEVRGGMICERCADEDLRRVASLVRRELEHQAKLEADADEGPSEAP